MNMRIYSVREAVGQIFGENEGKVIGQHNDSNEQVSEEDDDVGHQSRDTDTSHQDFTGAESAPTLAETFNSKSGNMICCSSVPTDVHGRPAEVNVIRMTPVIPRVTVK